jgi:hypothetical protein
MTMFYDIFRRNDYQLSPGKHAQKVRLPPCGISNKISNAQEFKRLSELKLCCLRLS